MNRLLMTFVAFCLTAVGSAQSTLIVPATAANRPGDGANAFPWGTSASIWPGLRVLCTYGAQNFSSLGGPQRPIVITELKWRRDDVGSSQTGGTFSAATIRMSTSPVGYQAVTTNFAANHGADLTTVYSGPVVYEAHTGGLGWTPESFCVRVVLQTPFVYDPALGDLVVDVDYLGTSFSGGTIGALDMQLANSYASRVYASIGYPNANNLQVNYAPVIGLVYRPAYAETTVLGTGCNGAITSDSFYQYGPRGTFNLNYRMMSMTADATGYRVSGEWVAMRSVQNAAPLLLTDESAVTIPLLDGWIPDGFYAPHTSLTVCSNGYVSLGDNGVSRYPDSYTMLAAPHTSWRCWHDFDPGLAGSGAVRWEETPTHVYVTWDHVATNGRPGTQSTFQFQFEKLTPNVRVVFGQMDTVYGDYLVGFSQGGASSDPGSRNLSTDLNTGFHVNLRTNPLVQSTLFRPVLGSTMVLSTDNVPLNAPLGITFVGARPTGGTSLASIGMPGCTLYTSPDVLFPFVPRGSSGAIALPLPSNTGLCGLELHSQSFVVAPGANALGALTSNALKHRLGMR